jgi:cell division protein ZapA
MADVRLSVANREYIVTCKDGEEARLAELGQLVDEKAREAGGAGGLNESRTLLFAALLLADQLIDIRGADGTAPQSAGNDAELASSLERLAERLEKLAHRA